MERTQKKLNEANTELDKLVGVRTRIIQRKLKEVQELPEGKSTQFLEEESSGLDFFVPQESKSICASILVILSSTDSEDRLVRLSRSTKMGKEKGVNWLG